MEDDTDQNDGDDVSILWCGPQPSRGRCLSAAAAPASSPPPPPAEQGPLNQDRDTVRKAGDPIIFKGREFFGGAMG